MNYLSIGINAFVRRQTPESEFTHFLGDWEDLPELVKGNFHNKLPGYRDGVCLVPIPSWLCSSFFCGVVELVEGDRLVGEYRARRPGEEPRKSLNVVRKNGKSPCKAVDIVLYRRNVLEEGGEDCTGCDWDIISINGRLEKDPMPISPETLIANHFQLDGGTATGMTPEEFEAALKKSVLYWKNKALIASKE